MSGILPYDIYYVNSAGERLELSELPFVVTGGQLFDSCWNLSTVSRPFGEGVRLLRARHSPDERTLEIKAAASSARKLSAVLARMSEIFDRDTASLTPGRLYVNGQYMTCWCSARKKELSCDFTATAAVTVTVLPECPLWCRERHYHLFTDQNAEYTPAAGHEYVTGTDTLTVTNSSVLSAPLRLTFEGPAENPSVYIGENQAGANVTLAAGEQLVIDQMAKTVCISDAAGESINCFHTRMKNGSTFAPIAHGSTEIVISNAPAVGVTVIEQRSEPEWSLN